MRCGGGQEVMRAGYLEFHETKVCVVPCRWGCGESIGPVWVSPTTLITTTQPARHLKKPVTPHKSSPGSDRPVDATWAGADLPREQPVPSEA